MLMFNDFFWAQLILEIEVCFKKMFKVLLNAVQTATVGVDSNLSQRRCYVGYLT